MAKNRKRRKKNPQSGLLWLGLGVAGLYLLSSGDSDASTGVGTSAGMTDAMVRKIFNILAVFESFGDYAALAVRSNPNSPHGMEVAYGVLQSQIHIGWHEILTKFVAEKPSSTYTPTFKKYIPLLKSITAAPSVSSALVYRIVNGGLQTGNTNNDLRKALEGAGRNSTTMQKVQREYFIANYLKKIFAIGASIGIRNPITYL